MLLRPRRALPPSILFSEEQEVPPSIGSRRPVFSVLYQYFDIVCPPPAQVSAHVEDTSAGEKGGHRYTRASVLAASTSESRDTLVHQCPAASTPEFC
eukprot:8308185-Alexandrium_andersonii.AAC.1